MAAHKQKKITKKQKEIQENTEDLYICLHDSTSKRKLLLTALKHSLIVQEEYEQILTIRSEKKVLVKEVKSNLDKINIKYQNLRKMLPNVKNVLSYTEKELTELEKQIDNLKHTISSEEKILEEEMKLEAKLKESQSNTTPTVPEVQTETEIKKVANLPKKVKEFPKVKKTTTKKQPINKLDRIKNNLSLIESKLKSL